jgi:hypothetical protein
VSNAAGVLDMAKKKAGAGGGRGTGPESWKRQPLIANFRGSDAFKEWMRELADFDRESVAGVIERALVHYAKSLGFSKEAPKR